MDQLIPIPDAEVEDDMDFIKMITIFASAILLIGVGMFILTGESGYSSETPPLNVMALPLLTIALTLALGVAGYLHRDDE